MSIDTNTIKQAIYRKYIEPTRHRDGRYIGVEFEIPIVNKARKAVDFSIVFDMVDAFAAEFGFDEQIHDDEGNISSISSGENGDDLSFDCSYNTLEFSFGREKNLNDIHDRFCSYYSFVREFLEKHGHTVTGMGINPYFRYNNNIPVPNGRYRMLLHHLSSYRNYKGKLLFHDIPYYGLISCSAQTHLDVTEDELIRVINVFNRLEPLKALLFANSPYEGGYLCVRDHLWRESMHGLNPHNVDGFDIELGSVEELVSYIKSMSLYCLERDGRYINFTPIPLDEYFSSSRVEGEYFDGNDYRTISWEPRIEDLEYLRSFKFVDLTFRGTVELRSTCMQPISEALGVPAFNLGLKVNLDKLEKLLDTEGNIYRQGYNVIELRKLFVMRKLPAFAEEEGVRDLLLKVLDIARDGLISRGYGEERFLEPLYRRVKTQQSAALEIVQGIEAGRTIEDYIDKYGRL